LRRFLSATPLLTILIILLLAAATRIINAGHFPVWTDEGWSTWATSDHRLEVILDKVAQDRHPPLYFLSLSGWWTIAGNSRIALRFLSIAGGILTVAAVYRIGADWFGRSAARYTALLVAVLDVTVYFSQEIRHYSWLTLSVCLMTLFFLRYLRQPRTSLLIGYVLSITFMLYSLYIGILILFVQIGIGLLAWRGSVRHKIQLVVAWIVAGLLYAPWLFALSRQLNTLVDGIDGYPTNFDGLLTILGILFGSQLALTAGLYLIGTGNIITALLKHSPSVSYSPLPEREEQVVRVCWLAQMTIVLSGVGLLGLMFVGNLWIGVLSARTLVFLAPMLMLICGYGLSLLNPQVRRIFVVALIAVALVTTDFIQPRLDYHLAAQAVAADYTPGDLIILEDGWDDNAFRYELMLALPAAPEPEIIRTLPWVGNRFVIKPVVPQVEDQIKAHRRVWVVNWLQPPQVIPYLDQGNHNFVRVLTRETSTGAQYKGLYDDTIVRAILFERLTFAEPPRVYGEILALRDTLVPSIVERGRNLHIDLWWSALKIPLLDYSVGVFLLDSAGKVRGQHDIPPGKIPTTRWEPGILTFDRHTIPIPPDLPLGTYKVGVQVYWYGDRVPLTVAGEKYAIIGEVRLGD
jgi:hypothetical protein